MTSSYIDLVSSMSVADAEAELVRSSYGFYGLPNYRFIKRTKYVIMVSYCCRPYGFTYAGYGSVGYGLHPTFIKSPNIYGGYITYFG